MHETKIRNAHDKIFPWIQEEESEDRWRTTIACLNDPSCTKHHYDAAGLLFYFRYTGTQRSLRLYCTV